MLKLRFDLGGKFRMDFFKKAQNFERKIYFQIRFQKKNDKQGMISIIYGSADYFFVVFEIKEMIHVLKK